MKKMIAVVVAGVMALSLAACGGSGDGQNGGSTGKENAADATYKVGICQLVQHEALDAATKGFIDALNDELGEGTVAFDEQNAQNDSNTCSTIINNFVSADVDLILANATPALQAAAAGTNEIPILGTSVTEYGVALGIEDFDGLVGNNISGTSDLAPLDQQAQMIKDLFPDVKKIGLLYCSAEQNSQYQVDTMKTYLEGFGYSCELYAFSDSNDLSSVATSCAQNSNLLYVPTDNTVASNAGIIDNICSPEGIPVVTGEEGECAVCGVVTLSISYYDLGYGTGQMAVKILTGEADVSQMPIEYAPTFTKKYNKAKCEQLNITVPEDYVAIE